MQQAIREHRRGNFPAAEPVYRQLLREKPEDPVVVHQLGLLLGQTGRIAEALRHLEVARRARPDDPQILGHLGVTLGQAGRHAEAVSILRRALRAQPNSSALHFNLGVALEQLGEAADALEAFERSASLDPRNVDALTSSGNMLRRLTTLDEAEQRFLQALAIQPSHVGATDGLASVRLEKGDAAAAAGLYERILGRVEIAPEIHSNYLHTLNHCANQTPQRLLDAAREWAKRLDHDASHAGSCGTGSGSTGPGVTAPGREQRYPNVIDRHRPLRVGYVSGDFRKHPTGRWMEPALERHDRSNFEVYCYSDVRQPDEVTARLGKLAGVWRDVRPLSVDQVEEQIRKDQIDILIDLAGHTGNRLLTVFGRKPAPVQVSHYGYPGTTGLRSIDYRLTDDLIDPPGVNDGFYSETIVRLPGCAWMYRPFTDMPVAAVPSASKGYPTFGCLNRAAKLSDEMLTLWVDILREMKTSRLLVLAEGAQRVAKFLNDHGVSVDRLIKVDRRPFQKYLAVYGHIDVCLDTFPHNGGITTLDSLWMGVPVVSLTGRTCPSRLGRSLLHNVGYHGLVVDSPEDYVRTAVELASNPVKLHEMRCALRPALLRSPLCDEVGYMRHFEAALRDFWNTWCEQWRSNSTN